MTLCHNSGSIFFAAGKQVSRFQTGDRIERDAPIACRVWEKMIVVVVKGMRLVQGAKNYSLYYHNTSRARTLLPLRHSEAK